MQKDLMTEKIVLDKEWLYSEKKSMETFTHNSTRLLRQTNYDCSKLKQNFKHLSVH